MRLNEDAQPVRTPRVKERKFLAKPTEFAGRDDALILFRSVPAIVAARITAA
jgi:hypothetical protein